MIDLSIVIPCYNEKNSLPNLLEACHRAIGTRNDVEVILVDNGSTDGSDEALSALMRESTYSFARVITVVKNIGYGHGIMQGVRQARGAVIGWTHADEQTDPGDVIRAFERFKQPLLTGKALVKGNRIGRNAFDTLFTLGMSITASFLLSARLWDINAQPKVFSRSLTAHLEDHPDDFSLDLFILFQARRLGIEILEIPVHYGIRTKGQAKGGGNLAGKIKLTTRTVKYLLAFRKKARRGREREGNL